MAVNSYPVHFESSDLTTVPWHGHISLLSTSFFNKSSLKIGLTLKLVQTVVLDMAQHCYTSRLPECPHSPASAYLIWDIQNCFLSINRNIFIGFGFYSQMSPDAMSIFFMLFSVSCLLNITIYFLISRLSSTAPYKVKHCLLIVWPHEGSVTGALNQKVEKLRIKNKFS